MRRVLMMLPLALAVGCGDSETELGDVIGTVVDSGGSPVAGATARLTGTSLTDLTGSDGRFALVGVPRGNHTVTVEMASANRLQHVETALFEFAGSTVDLGPLRLGEVGQNGLEVGELTGRVFDDAGGPVIDAEVELRSGDGLADSTRSGTTGGFAFRRVAPGTYRVVATVQDGAGNVRRGSRDGLVVTRSDTGRQVQNASVVVVAENRLGTLQGTVTDTRGRPVAGARVSVDLLPAANEAALVTLTTTTNAVGAYVLTDVPDTPGGAAVTVVAAGFAAASRSVDITGGGSRTEDFELGGAEREIPRAPTQVTALAVTYPIGGGDAASRQAYAARRAALGGRLARFVAGGPTRRPPPGSLIEVQVAYRPSLAVDTSAQILYRSHTQALGTELIGVARSESPNATLLADLADGLSIETTYVYRLTTLSARGLESTPSDAAQARPLPRLQAVAPADGDTGVLTSGIQFQWTTVRGAQGYQVVLFEEFPGVGVEPLFTSDVLPIASDSYRYEAPPLEPSTVYYWYVVAFDARQPEQAAAESYGPIRRFTTGTASR